MDLSVRLKSTTKWTSAKLMSNAPHESCTHMSRTWNAAAEVAGPASFPRLLSCVPQAIEAPHALRWGRGANHGACRGECIEDRPGQVLLFRM